MALLHSVAKLEQGPRRAVDGGVAAQFDLQRDPGAVASLDDGVDLESAAVAVAGYPAARRLGVDAPEATSASTTRGRYRPFS